MSFVKKTLKGLTLWVNRTLLKKTYFMKNSKVMMIGSLSEPSLVIGVVERSLHSYLMKLFS